MEPQSNEINPKSIEEIMHKSKFFNTEVLVHSNQPLRYLPEHMIKEFKKDFHLNMNKEHEIGLSHVFSGDSLLICTKPNDDPSLYYFPAFCRIIEKQILESHAVSVGPIAIIVVPTKLHAVRMTRLCAAFLSRQSLENNGLVMTNGDINNSLTCNQLKKGCGILVVTFAQFELFLAQNVVDNYIDKSRLKHVIIDDLDVMSSYNHFKLVELLSTLIKLCLTESNGQQIIVPQLIITSQSYNTDLIPFLIQHTRRPLIIFKDFIEASVYASMNLAIIANSYHLCSKNDSKKDSLLLEIKRFKKLKQRTIVFCKNLYDVIEVKEFLTQNGIDFLIGKHNNIKQVNDWESNLSGKILICTDDFQSFSIHNADKVIHYTYPDNWYLFKNRHSVLIGNYPNYMNTDFYSVNVFKPRVVALTDEHDTIILHLLIELLIKQKQEINPQVLQLANEQLHRSRLEYARQSFNICPNLAIYGSCKLRRCAFNHSMGPRDFLTRQQQICIPMYGIVSIQILHVYTPTHFAVRLLKWKESKRDTFRNLPLTYNTISNKLKRDMGYPEKYWPPKVGEICVVKVGSQYQRIRLLMFPTTNINANTNDRIVSGQFVDEDMRIEDFKCSELLVCPPAYQLIPPMVMHLYLSAILPNASLPQDTEIVKTWLSLESHCVNKIRYEAKILKVLTHTIFASKVTVYKQKWDFPEGKRLHLNNFLIKKGYGKYDSHNAYRIQKTCFSK